MTQTCAICSAVAGDDGSWARWILPEDIHWRSAFTHDGQEPPLPAGQYETCPTCTRWIPDSRTADLPAAVRQALDDTLTAASLHPITARHLRAELVGRLRHLAGQLQPDQAPSRPRKSGEQ
jgi:hypothetical protein